MIRIFLFWRLGLFLLTYLGSKILPLTANSGLGAVDLNKAFDYWYSWAQWDGGHFYNLANKGYVLVSDYAFFPLYPLLINIFSLFFFGNLLIAGLVISNISFLLFLLLFQNLLKKMYSSKIAFNATVTFLLFPTSFYAVSFYSESLFLLLVVVCFYFLKDKKFLLAAIFASIASLARNMGIFLAISIIYSYFSNIKFEFTRLDIRFLRVFVAFLGIIIFGLYSYAQSSNPLQFITAQSSWQRSIQDPVSTIIGNIWIIITNSNTPLGQYTDLLITLIFLALLIFGIKKIPSSWWIFSMLVILIPASTGTLASMPRYLLASLGVFIILGKLLEEKQYLKVPIWTVSLFLQVIIAVLFINGNWVA